MKLYSVHCGYYDAAAGDGIYESHLNFFVAAENFQEARSNAKQLTAFREKRMHVDGVQEIELVDGYRVELTPDPTSLGQTRIQGLRHRDLAPRTDRSA